MPLKAAIKCSQSKFNTTSRLSWESIAFELPQSHHALTQQFSRQLQRSDRSSRLSIDYPLSEPISSSYVPHEIDLQLAFSGLVMLDSATDDRLQIYYPSLLVHAYTSDRATLEWLLARRI
jgi:hypothetical protein